MKVHKKIKETLTLLGLPMAMTIASALHPVQAAESYMELMNSMGGNPADFAVDDGHALWKKPAGPKHASLEQCDLGLGPGVVKGAYAQLPRYFADTDRVQDLESRLVTCMQTLQGIEPAEAEKDALKKFNGDPSPLEKIAIYVAHQSDGMKVEPPQSHPKEREAFENGKKMFFYRGGPYNFSCAACHGKPDLRIRISKLPDLTGPQGSDSYRTWPAYPNTQGVARTLEWRMNDCFRQQRFPAPKFASDAVIDLIEYMAVNSKGSTLQTPSFKR